MVQPDLLSISNERAEIITKDNVRGAPDLVVEVLSPATADRDRTIKLNLYAEHGVNEYWIVDPYTRTIMVLLRGDSRFEVSGILGEGQTLQSPTLEGLSFQLEEVL